MLLVRDAVYFDLLYGLISFPGAEHRRIRLKAHTYHPQDSSRMRRRAGIRISEVSSKPRAAYISAYIWVCLDVLRWVLRCCWNVGHDLVEE